MKKIWIGIVVLCIGACAVVGGFYYEKTNSAIVNKVAISNLKTNNNPNTESSTLKNNSENKASNTTLNNSNPLDSTSNQSSSETKNINSNNVESNQKNSSGQETSSNQSNQKSIQSSTINLSDYMGTWTATKEMEWNQDYSQNIIPTESELKNNELILTKSKYSFNGVTINNPSYKLVKINEANLFDNAHLGGYGPINNVYSNNNSMATDLTFIVALPQGASEEYIHNATKTFEVTEFPYILNGNLYGMLNTKEKPIYQLTK